MGRSKGSVSIALLVVGLVVLLLAQIFYLYAGKEYEKHQQLIRAEQLRILCASTIETLSAANIPDENKAFNVCLYPGAVPAAVSSKVKFSDDQCIKYLEVTAECGELRQVLRQTYFSLPEAVKVQAHIYGIISGTSVTGAEFLPPETLYTGTGEVMLPPAEAFAFQAIEELPMETLRLNGLSKRFYYLDDYRGLTFDRGMKVYGSGLIAAQGNIIISDNCEFKDPIILLTEKKIEIGDNVKLPQALLLSRKGIKVGSGCSIGGVMMSNGVIEFTDTVSFLHHENLVAGFSSFYYIL